MKKTFALGILVFISVTLMAQTPAQIKEIQAPVLHLFDAIAALNDAGMKTEVTADYTLIEEGKVLNMDSLIAFISPLKGKGVKRVNKIDFIKTEQKGEVAWTYYHNTADMSIGDITRHVEWLESALLIKEKGTWKIKLMHVTTLTKPK